MTTILYLARHGETVDNARQVMQGQTQGQLNDTGRQQACELRDLMAAEHIDTFMASDLHRAIETARIVAEPHGKPVTTTPLLRERDWGSFTGRFIPELKDEVWPDDVETLDALRQRARAFLNYVKETCPGQRVLAVGHGIINKAIQSVFFQVDMRKVEKMRNAEVRMLELSD